MSAAGAVLDVSVSDPSWWLLPAILYGVGERLSTSATKCKA